MRAPLVASACVCLLGFLWVWTFATLIGEGVTTDCALSALETSSFRVETTTWPPGASRCVVEMPDGTTRSRVHVPWLDWLTVLMLAAAAGLATAAGAGRCRLHLAAVAVALVLAAGTVYFIGALPGIAVAAVAAATLTPRRRRPRQERRRALE